jgi:alpha-L-fucosidase
MRFRFGDGRDWFFEKRFGLFVHWGLYALLGWHEQHQWRALVPRKEYERLIDQFDPVRFNPDGWLDLAEEAGMEYVCFTTKHHDGFCLWDTAQTDYKVTRSPYGRDVLGMLAEACHKRGFPLCLYYSVADWHHPNYPNQGRSHELDGPQEGDEPDIDKYLEFMRAQVRELCTQYGDIRGFWWDMNVTGLRDPSINEMVRSLLPNAVINDRGFDKGDFGTPERDMDPSLDETSSFHWPTEACQSVGRESWGYKEDEDYYTDRHLTSSIDKVLARGGNYVLNVGPRADGTIPPESAEILRRIGKWYRAVRESFDGTDPASQMADNHDVLLTRRGNSLYVHLYRPATTARVLLKPMTALPHRATLLNTGQEVETRVDSLPTEVMGLGGRIHPGKQEYLRIRGLPANELANTVMVVRLDFDELP